MSVLSSLVQAVTKSMADGRRRMVVLSTRHAFDMVYNPKNFAQTEAIRLAKQPDLRVNLQLEKKQ